MQDRIDTKREFTLMRRAQSLSNALKGLLLFVKTTPNVWIQGGICIGAFLAGGYFSITQIEWMFIILASGLVFASEAFNTAIEIDIDLTSPEYHPYARDTKDVAAGAVLIASLTASAIGLIVFVPYTIALFA